MEPPPRAAFHDGLNGEVGADSPGTTLRVATVCPYSLSRPGGVQSQAVGLTRTLEARGHRAVLFAPLDHPGDAPQGIEFEPSGRSMSVRSNGSVAPVSFSLRAAARSSRTIRAFAPDVVHLHEPFAPGLSYLLLAGHPRRPLVGTFHRSGASVWYSLLRPLTAPMARRLAVRCAVSDAARTTAASALGGHYEVLFNGIEIERLRSSDPWPTDRRALFFLGRHEARKGLEVLLEAFDRLLARGGPRCGPSRSRPVLWIAGDGPLTDTLRHRYPESEDRHWLGVLTEGEKNRRLAAADLVCAPSLAGESFGMVLLEAMAARAVVVASDIEGYRDAAGGHAVLVAPGDVEALVGALDGVLAGQLAISRSVGPPGGASDGGAGSPAVDVDGGRRRWLESAAARAEQWSMDRLAERYEALYLSVVAGPGR